jgi:rRNA-processing protein FCF1
VVLVVEGAAGAVADEAGPETVTVMAADGSGDDAIVDLVARSQSQRRVVVTADRELRDRVAALGAEVVGPRALPHLRR